LPDGDFRGAGDIWRRRTTDLEADAYAGNLPDECLCDKGRKWTGEDECIYKMEEKDVGADIFERGVCLPSDNKMTKEEQEKIIEIVGRCFGKVERK